MNRQSIQRALEKFPHGGRMVDAMRVLRRGLANVTYSVERGATTHPERFPPGHYYSAIPDFEVLASEFETAATAPAEVRGVDLRLDQQVELIRAFGALHESEPFWSPERRIRFQIENDTFSYDDAPVLNYMLRTLRPERVIEVGSGHSSACMLDTNDLYLDGKIEFTFIDIDCSRVRKVISNADAVTSTLIEAPIQTVDLTIFDALNANDVLFIDSSHVTKHGSDVNHLFFEVLPRLNPGVVVHLHDIRYPFQYPKGHLEQRIAWNEAYLLRSFLSFNRDFEVMFWLNCLLNVDHAEPELLRSILPLEEAVTWFGGSPSDVSDAGGSIWLRRTGG